MRLQALGRHDGLLSSYMKDALQLFIHTYPALACFLRFGLGGLTLCCLHNNPSKTEMLSLPKPYTSTIQTMNRQ